jgi:hypothetical protein
MPTNSGLRPIGAGSLLQGLFLLFLITISTLAAAAGGGDGSVAGLVSDASGARIPIVKVELMNQATGVALRTTSNSEGYYSFPAAPTGSYELRFAHEGFISERHGGVSLSSGTSLRIDIVLQVESHSDALTVVESSVAIETASSQLGEVIDAKHITGVPMNGRSYTDLLALQPGVIPITSQQLNAVVMSGCTSSPPSGDLNPGNLSVSGQRETTNGFVVNGSTAQEDFNMGAAVVPNLESIQDFRVLTSGFDAQYGNFSGGQVVVTTKSGANQLHGAVFEFLRNTSLDARSFFATQRAAYDRNQFGATLGGPIRKNKAFFFADYQGTRMTQGVDTGLISVPSLQDRTGNRCRQLVDRHGERPVLGEHADSTARLRGPAG